MWPVHYEAHLSAMTVSMRVISAEDGYKVPLPFVLSSEALANLCFDGVAS